MRKSVAVVAYILAFLSALCSGLYFYQLRSWRGAWLWLPKMAAGSLSPFAAVVGALGAALGALVDAPLAVLAGGVGAVLSIRYVLRVSAPPSGDQFDRVFGADWRNRIPPQQEARMLRRRWLPRMPTSPEPCWQRDIPFWTIPGTDRKLLCDVWQPPLGVEPSGVACIYFHGSAWHMLDKDFGTRPFFRHLAAQGHVVMDVAYRLCPETDFTGMIGDVQRAIAWMKANAGEYGVDPARIVVAGASAGAHLALLAAYAPHHPRMMPNDVQGLNLSVRAVVAYYPPTDLRAVAQRIAAVLPDKALLRQPHITRARVRGHRVREQFVTQKTALYAMDLRHVLRNLLGGDLSQVPEMYDLASPVTHVRSDCPPTLLLQGEHDQLVYDAGRVLYRRLLEAGAPVIFVEFPQTEHAFDLFVLAFSPPAQAALYDVDRFLALVAL